MQKKYKNGIYIGKFYPIHLGHISSVINLSYVCENTFMLFFSNEENERKLSENAWYTYDIDTRIEDCKEVLKQHGIQVAKINITDNRAFPENRDEIFEEVKKVIGRVPDIQIFGSEESEIYIPHRFSEEFITSSPYVIENKDNELEILHSSQIRSDFEFYQKHLPSQVRERILKLRGRQ